MKIIVQHEKGEREVITLTEPLQIVRGLDLNRIVTATGMEHFFTLEGYYDGFGRGAAEGMTEEDANTMLDQLINEREFPGPEEERHG
jgi:hypothetical protein